MTFKKIRFVTDSTCDIPPELLKKHNIGVVPCYINYGDKSFADDGIALVREEFYTVNLPTRMRPPRPPRRHRPATAEEVIQQPHLPTPIICS